MSKSPLDQVNDKLICNLTFQRDALERQNVTMRDAFRHILTESELNSDVRDFARYCIMVAKSAIESSK